MLCKFTIYFSGETFDRFVSYFRKSQPSIDGISCSIHTYTFQPKSYIKNPLYDVPIYFTSLKCNCLLIVRITFAKNCNRIIILFVFCFHKKRSHLDYCKIKLFNLLGLFIMRNSNNFIEWRSRY